MAKSTPREKKDTKKSGSYTKFYKDKKTADKPKTNSDKPKGKFVKSKVKFEKSTSKSEIGDEKKGKFVKTRFKKEISRDKKSETVTESPTFSKDGTMRLNKYIAHAGVCSRREADSLIETGVITVNGKIITELGYKVSQKDKVSMDGQTLKAENLQYVLLNKPKGFITTTEDPEERKTVMSLVEKACKERIYPIGRLDKNTTGVLLFTNDGDLAKKLTHPKHNIRKLYHVVLDKDLSKRDMLKITEGIQLEDGLIAADKASYVDDKGKNNIGIEIHSGKNRIVRRIFEHLEYKVVKLDRVIFGGLTKKDLPRGKWRHLSAKEINFLKVL